MDVAQHRLDPVERGGTELPTHEAKLVRREGIEPSTYWLRVGFGSADEPGPIGAKRDETGASPRFRSKRKPAWSRFVPVRAAIVGLQSTVIQVRNARPALQWQEAGL